MASKKIINISTVHWLRSNYNGLDFNGNNINHNLKCVDWKLIYPIHGYFINDFMKLDSFDFDKKTLQLHYFGGNWIRVKNGVNKILDFCFDLSLKNSNLRSENR